MRKKHYMVPSWFLNKASSSFFLPSHFPKEICLKQPPISVVVLIYWHGNNPFHFVLAPQRFVKSRKVFLIEQS